MNVHRPASATPSACSYQHEHFRDTLTLGLERGYTFRACADYAAHGPVPEQLLAVMRHDIDLLPERAPAMALIEADLGIRSTYFFRVHANEYNAFGHETLAIMRDLADMGHEIGFHAEPLDLQASTGVEPGHAIKTSVAALEALLGREIKGVASHNDITPDNNLDYFRRVPAADLGLSYEAYDDSGLDLFAKSYYVTDGHFWYWRTFRRGELTEDRSCLCAHFDARHAPVYALLHPHVWFAKHFHRVNH